MKKWLVLLIVLVTSLVGCSSEEATEGEKQTSDEAVRTIEDIKEDDIIASIHDHDITGKDLIYEMKRLELIAFLQEEPKELIEISPAVAIQELVQNHLIHELAQEQGIAVNKVEQEERAEAVRADIKEVDGYETVMEGIDEKLFWSREQARYEVILEAEALIAQLVEVEKEQHPDYTEQALRFDAREELDMLIQQKIADTEMEIYIATS